MAGDVLMSYGFFKHPTYWAIPSVGLGSQVLLGSCLSSCSDGDVSWAVAMSLLKWSNQLNLEADA